MPECARLVVDKILTGHPCDIDAPIKGRLVTKVFIEGEPVAVEGDLIEPHDILRSGCVPHLDAVINIGSTKVFCEGIPIARIGDSADEGEVQTGSSKVFAGG